MWKETFYLFPAKYQKLINFALNFCSSDGNDLRPRTAIYFRGPWTKGGKINI